MNPWKARAGSHAPAEVDAAQPLDDGVTHAHKVLRQQAEAAYLRRSEILSNPLEQLSPQAAQHLLHELQVHQIELEMQNDELRRVQAELELARSRYFDLYQLAPVGYLTLNAQGLIEQANMASATLFGRDGAELLAQPLTRFIFRDDQDAWHLLRRKLAGGAAAQTCEMRMMRPDGAFSWVQLQVSLVQETEQTLRVVLNDIHERKQTHVALQTSHEVQTVLLHEVHHRVKNNLQIINSLLRLEAARCPQVESKTVLGQMQGRIRAMAILHELLYRAGTLASVDLGTYLRELAAQVFRAQGSESEAVSLQLELASVPGGMDQAIACGLLVNELVTNCLKHAFPDGRAGEVRVVLQALGSAEGGKLPLRLRVSDDGVGLGADFDSKRQSSLGLHLVGDLSKQIGGELAVGPVGGPGAVFSVTFSVDQSKLPKAIG